MTLHDLAKPGLYLVRELPREYERRDLLKKNAVEKLGKIQTGLFVCLPVCGLLGRRFLTHLRVAYEKEI